MITLITGVPGSGKTAYCVAQLAEVKDRPIFTMGIPELQIESHQCPPMSEWAEFRKDENDPSISLPYFTFPPNALVVVDEAQRVFRPRGVGSKVPPEVAAFETHRHTGIDFILLTQNPTLLDSNIRKLVGRHVHIRVTAFGRQKYEWPELGEPDNKASREIAARTKYTLPKRAFALYKSSELHTKTRVAIPAFYWLFLLAMLATIALAGYAYQRIGARIGGEVSPVAQVESVTKADTKTPSSQEAAKPLAVPAYVFQTQERVPDKPYTAPMFDGVVVVESAPLLAGCYQKGDVCKCVTQQGTPYPADKKTCREQLAQGAFQWWRPEQGAKDAAMPVKPLALNTPKN